MMSLRSASLACAAALLAGCATLNSVQSEVTSYGQWPAGRAPGTYAFERLPSQQAHGEEQAQLEAAARGALEKAGFRAATNAGAADVTVQVGARVSRADRSPWDDPLWWRWGASYWRGPGWRGSGFGLSARYDLTPQYEREVALLIRDRVSGAPLYETRASNAGYGSGGVSVLAAMYEAALKDFPTVALNPRRVRVPLSD
jgi:hypothetical protein